MTVEILIVLFLLVAAVMLFATEKLSVDRLPNQHVDLRSRRLQVRRLPQSRDASEHYLLVARNFFHSIFLVILSATCTII